MKTVERKTFIDSGMINKESILEFDRATVLCGGDVGDHVECNLTCTVSPPEAETLEYPGCPASVDDLYIYMDDIEITEMITKDQINNIEIEIWESLQD